MDHFATTTIDSLDFEMLLAAPVATNQSDVVAVHHGHRLISATVYWRATGDVFVSIEGTGGESLDVARTIIAWAIREALTEVPARPNRTAQGPQFYAGRGFARSLSRALRAGTASIVNG